MPKTTNSCEKISGVLGELKNQSVFFDIDLVRKIYTPSDFKRKYSSGKDSEIPAYSIFESSKVTEELKIILVEINGVLAGISVDKVIRLINKEELPITPVTKAPPGHDFLIFDSVITLNSSHALCFAKSGLEKMITLDTNYAFLWEL